MCPNNNGENAMMPNNLRDQMMKAVQDMGMHTSMLAGDEGEAIVMFRPDLTSDVLYRWSIKCVQSEKLSRLRVKVGSNGLWQYVCTTYVGKGEKFVKLLNKSMVTER